MTRSACWSLLALGLAVLNYVMHRDISTNIFFATFIFIQALKRPAEEDHLVTGRMVEFAACAGAALLTFAIFSRLLGIEWSPPASW
ncbi:hypothetical protein ACIPZ5_00950 [Pseudomonas sp. NPDC089428]|uniref:hypothetical protein n=1 Tax=Pseudomonas sp. NPDC089428 TaxID=3364467 RepID=UPI00380BDB47